MKTIKTHLPLFTGYYNTIFESLLEAYQMQEQGVDEDSDDAYDLQWDDAITAKFTEKIVNKVVALINTELTIPCELIENEGLKSPKYYNYSNDVINVTLDIASEKVLELAFDKYRSEVQKLIKSRYSNRPGFLSYHSNKIEDWETDLRNDFENETHKVGAILDMLLINEMSEDYLIHYLIEL